MSYEEEMAAIGRMVDKQIAEAKEAARKRRALDGAPDRKNKAWEDDERVALMWLRGLGHTEPWIAQVLKRTESAVASEITRLGLREPRSVVYVKEEDKLPIPLPGFKPERLKRYREDMGYSHEELAKVANVPPGTLRAFEAGRLPIWGYVAARVAKALFIEVSDLTK